MGVEGMCCGRLTAHASCVSTLFTVLMYADMFEVSRLSVRFAAYDTSLHDKRAISYRAWEAVRVL